MGNSPTTISKMDSIRILNKDHGSGSSKTGNVCRRLFSNPGKHSEITDADRELIERLRNILIANAE
jgi:hypothetical protein